MPDTGRLGCHCVTGWAAAGRRTVRGQTIHLYRDMTSASTQAAPTVSSRPPKKPSHVFFGESLMRGVLPKQMPAVQSAQASARMQGTAGL